MKSVIGSLLILGASMVQAANHVVVLGQGGALKFVPDQVVAAVGDTVEFQFAAGVASQIFAWLISRITPSRSLPSPPLAYLSPTESGPASSSSRNQPRLAELPPPQQPPQAKPHQEDTHTWRNVKPLPSPHSPSPSTTQTHCGSTAPRPNIAKTVWSWPLTSMPP